jgi:DNA-binding Lrp family transcriptional regulator
MARCFAIVPFWFIIAWGFQGRSMTPTLQPLTARLTTRASVALLLDLVKIGRVGRTLNDGAISLSIIQANVGPITNSPELQRAYATLDRPPPDELRRPVSVNAIANALRLPYETVRRRVAYLASQGVCEITPRGVVAPTAVLATPAHRALLEYNSSCLEAFYGRLRDIGFLGPPVPNVERFPADDPPLRAIARVSSDYVLRLLEYLTRRIGDLVQCLIFLEVLRTNTEGVTDAERGIDHQGDLGYLANERRKPISISALSARLDMPTETVRRHVSQMVEAGRLERGPAGLIVPSAQLTTPEISDVLRDNAMFVTRMFASLAPLGVLIDWEERRLAAGAPTAMAVGL